MHTKSLGFVTATKKVLGDISSWHGNIVSLRFHKVLAVVSCFVQLECGQNGLQGYVCTDNGFQ